MLEIISHRGFWKNPSEQNRKKAFIRSLENGFGIETDVRDYCGELVISHDIPNGECLSWCDFLKEYVDISSRIKETPWLAINIKSDGLQEKVKVQLMKYNIKNYFVFDMSIPDTLSYLNQNIRCFVRQSEFEQLPMVMKGYEGVWLDQFNSTWFNEDILYKNAKNNLKLCIVSPELHGRDYSECWKLIKKVIKKKLDTKEFKVMICTDYPDIAEEYFNGK